MLRKIVLTGGPGAGKTTLAQDLRGDYPTRFRLVPEAATQVFHELGAHWRELDAEGRRDVQRRIYRRQLEQEDRIVYASADEVALLDRGTVDGAAYWPDGPGDYWASMGTTHQRELGRYDAVIHLETCAVLEVYDGPASNPFRHEARPAAIECDRALTALWSPHRAFAAVTACHDMRQKRDAVHAILRRWGVIRGGD